MHVSNLIGLISRPAATTPAHHGSVSSASSTSTRPLDSVESSRRPPYFDLDLISACLVLETPQRDEKRMLTSTRLSNRGYRQPVTSVIGERKHRGRPTT